MILPSFWVQKYGPTRYPLLSQPFPLPTFFWRVIFRSPPLVSVPRQKGWWGEGRENPSLRGFVETKMPQKPWVTWRGKKKNATPKNHRFLQAFFLWGNAEKPTISKREPSIENDCSWILGTMSENRKSLSPISPHLISCPAVWVLGVQWVNSK